MPRQEKNKRKLKHVESYVKHDEIGAKRNASQFVNIHSLVIKKTLLFSGLTPVHLAVQAGSKDVLKLLNSAGANMSAQV